MTLAQERAATRAGITAARTNTLRRDLNSLETQRRQIRELVTLDRRGLRPATKGRGTWDANKAKTTGGGGIASPLTELVFADREYWETGFPSSDGLFILPAIKTLKLQDVDEAEVVINLADPGAV
ncbi:hypothetical protein E8E95_05800 [Pseudomonas sp. BN414]|uniref:hypothetical protein n=1 Tax=Pseudomonas sp. BN414 TaxID=2567888 RepID=UPI0024559DD3|nr:hypothetical protein [Pseudomonas sp. BN414]MDH4566187.1 hypothetical protein [Pseudomonas sp. BN414]